MEHTVPAKRARVERPPKQRRARGKRESRGDDDNNNDNDNDNDDDSHSHSSGAAPPAPVDRRVRLNVGGTCITTLESTLRSEPSKLAEWMDSDFAGLPRDAEGYPFIDRDPENFKHIINFLRGYELPLATEKIVFLAEDAEFYRIEKLRALIDPPAQWRFESGPGVSADGTIFSTDTILGVCGNEALPPRGKSFIALRIDKCELMTVGVLGTESPMENESLQQQTRSIAYCNTGELVRSVDDEKTYTSGTGFKSHDLITIEVDFAVGSGAKITFYRGDAKAYETEWPAPVPPLRFAVSMHGSSSATIERSGILDSSDVHNGVTESCLTPPPTPVLPLVSS